MSEKDKSSHGIGNSEINGRKDFNTIIIFQIFLFSGDTLELSRNMTQIFLGTHKYVILPALLHRLSSAILFLLFPPELVINAKTLGPP